MPAVYAIPRALVGAYEYRAIAAVEWASVSRTRHRIQRDVARKVCQRPQP